MIRYRVRHRTAYAYAAPVLMSRHRACLAPRARDWQTIEGWRLSIEPAPTYQRTGTDAFGNAVTTFTVEEPHAQLVVTSEFLAEVFPAAEVDPAATAPWEEVRTALMMPRRAEAAEAAAYAFTTPAVPLWPELQEIGAEAFAPGKPVLAVARDLCAWINDAFTFDAEATDVATPLQEVIAERRGVCQDFAHVMLALWRARGLAARYVSGYIQTRPPPGRPRLVGADASHAWVSVHVPEVGWVDFDPTNNLTVAEEHVTLAWGRDFNDVSPIKGVMLGGGDHSVEVSVDMAPQGAAAG